MKEGSTICITGTLTDEGIECQTLRSIDGQLYTLVGNLDGYAVGDVVYVAGTVARGSFCMMGTTLVIHWISKKQPKIGC